MTEQFLIKLTESAIEKVKIMKAKDDKEDCCLRIGVITGGCAGLSYDMRFQKEPYENDTILEQGGLKILINQESIPFIKGLEIDYLDTLKKSGFQYKNPNAEKSCGCGSSFS